MLIPTIEEPMIMTGHDWASSGMEEASKEGSKRKSVRLEPGSGRVSSI